MHVKNFIEHEETKAQKAFNFPLCILYLSIIAFIVLFFVSPLPFWPATWWAAVRVFQWLSALIILILLSGVTDLRNYEDIFLLGLIFGIIWLEGFFDVPIPMTTPLSQTFSQPFWQTVLPVFKVLELIAKFIIQIGSALFIICVIVWGTGEWKNNFEYIDKIEGVLIGPFLALVWFEIYLDWPWHMSS